MVVIYHVRVHQNKCFWTIDHDQTFIQLIGTKGTSNRLRLVGSSVQLFELPCPASLGTILLVSLDAHLATSVWYCNSITLTTPEGGTMFFPCHRFVSCSRTLVLRDSIARLVFEDIRPVELEQRFDELAYRRETFRWGGSDDIIPKSLRSKDSLPPEVRFSIAKATDLILTVGEALVELGLQGLLCEDQPWTSLEQIHQVFRWRMTHTLEYVEEHWKEDVFFGEQFLNGVNPMLIRRCHHLPDNFPVTEEMVRGLLQGGASLNDELQRGNVFLVDYSRLDGVTANVVNGKQQYLCAPLVLLHLDPRYRVLPIAIQLKQTPGQDNPIFLPSDAEYDWLLAKVYVRMADFLEHELNAHLLRTHLLSEVFAMATLRNFPMVHPLYKLLIPHFRYTLEIDTLARELLISDTGTFTKYTAIGAQGVVDFLKNSAAMLTYSSLCVPDDIGGRGLDSLPGFYYRDDGLRLWNIIHRYVEGVVNYYYHSKSDVIKDTELQSWINEIVVFGALTEDTKGFPRSFTSVQDLSYFVTMVIFTATAQHAAVNNGQFDYFGWMPNAPVSLQLPPPATKGQCNQCTMLASFPDVNASVHGLATVYLLSKKPTDFVPLGGSTDQHFTEMVPLEKLKQFRQDLKILGYEIRVRNVGLPVPYTFLLPDDVEDSVAR